MKIAIITILILAILAGGGFLANRVLNPPAQEIAEEYLTLVVAQEFAKLEALYHSQHPYPLAADLATSFSQFASEFGLLETKLDQITLLEESLTNARYEFEIVYTSRYFEPLRIKSELALARDGIFDWKVEWADIFPLPDYGLQASYHRSRSEPARGSIYDRNGNVLAGKGSLVSIGVQPGRISDPELLDTVLEEMLGLSPTYVRRQYQAPGVQDHWFVPLITVTEQEYLRVDPILRPIAGIFFRRQDSRVYPAEAITGHITGYLGEVSAEMMAQYPNREYQVGSLVGRSGLEYGLEEQLRGMPGYTFFVEPANGQRVPIAERMVANGEDTNLTLDLGMQALAMNLLADVPGALVLVDANTGEVLVLASTPSYDPNWFTLGMTTARWQELSTDPTRPMFNRALQGRYPPGSVFKVVTAAAALDQGLFTRESVFTDTGSLVVQGNIVRNFEQRIFADHTLEQAIVQSINTTMARVGLALGAETLRQYFSKWQLDQPPNLHLPASAGQIGNPERSQVALAWTAVGQDQVLLTPFKMASLFAAIANDGMMPRLRLVTTDDPIETDPVLRPETAQEMAIMLANVAVEGTGRAAAFEGLRLFGKTGTAEIGTDSTHAWFAGYIKDFHGRDLSFALLVEGGGVGGRTAAPMIGQYFFQLEQALEQSYDQQTKEALD